MQFLPFVLLALTTAVFAEDGFVPMFNGRDLTGGVNANCAPETWGVKDGVRHLHRPTDRRAAHRAAV
jgi:hypothetical protein